MSARGNALLLHRVSGGVLFVAKVGSCASLALVKERNNGLLALGDEADWA